MTANTRNPSSPPTRKAFVLALALVLSGCQSMAVTEAECEADPSMVWWDGRSVLVAHPRGCWKRQERTSSAVYVDSVDYPVGGSVVKP